MSGEGGPGPPRHDDAGHHAAHLAHHCDGDQVGDVDVGAELLQLNQPDEGQNHADQKADEGHDRQGVGTAILQDENDIGHAESYNFV